MKFTRSLPANAIASAKVPIKTIILNTLTRSRCRISLSTVDTTNTTKSSMLVLSFIQSFDTSLMNGEPPSPLMKMKYASAVKAIPPKMAMV